jgi:ribosomal protein S18 acetylase RimI-like enzyme
MSAVDAFGAVICTTADPRSAQARWAMTQYYAELDRRFPDGFDSTGSLDEAAVNHTPPRGSFVLVFSGDVEKDEPVACGGVHLLDENRGEIKRMWVAPGSRGRGYAGILLRFLEGIVRDAGRSTVVLDTNSVLTEAIALYERHGYERVERYNDNPYAQLWFAKSLDAPASPDPLVGPAPVSLNTPDDIDPGDLGELRRRIVDSVLASLLAPDEVDSVQLRVGGSPHSSWVDEPRAADEIWVLLDARGEHEEIWLCHLADEAWSAEDMASDFYTRVEDWLPETRFAWGEQRSGTYVVPPHMPPG